MIIVLAQTKGGVGKSTLAVNLAIARSLGGGDTLLVDADEQATATDFTALRTERLGNPGYTAISLTGGAVRTHILRLAPKYQDIIIDAGGRDTTSLRAALTVADTALIPFQPRSFDLWTLDKILSLLREAKGYRETPLRALTVLNFADPSGTDNAQAAATLDNQSDIIYLQTSIGRRKAFPNAAAAGLGVLEPPLSGSYSCLCQDARGCDVRSSSFAIDVAFALDALGLSLAGGDPLGVDMARQFHQPLGDGAWGGLTPNGPVFGRQGDEHALVAALDAQSEMEQRPLRGRLWWLMMCLLHTAADQGENVVGQQCHGKAEQRGPRLAEAADFTVQHAFQAWEHAFDAPASAVQLSHLCGTDMGWQIGPQPDRHVAVFGGCIEHEFDAPPGPGNAFKRNLLFADRAGVGAATAAPIPSAGQARMVRVRAHDEACTRCVPTRQQRAGAKMAVGDPDRPCLGLAAREWPACARFGGRPHPLSCRSRPLSGS